MMHISLLCKDTPLLRVSWFTASATPKRAPVMTDHATHLSLLDAVGRYFDLMFDNDISRFDQLFAASAQLHGLRDGNLRLLPAQDYKNALASGVSPKAKNAPRQQEILLVDFASDTQAVVKVRVRIDTLQYLDYLSFHCSNGAWLITAKSFHVERRYEATAG
jgi:hypothetical protein